MDPVTHHSHTPQPLKMVRFNLREQLPLHIKRAICAHHVENPRLRHVDLARWCYSHYGLRPDRSTVGRILKSAERRAVTATGDNQVRRRGGAWPELEQAMSRWIANAGPAGVPLTLQTIRDHVAAIARNMGIPPTFRCSIGWVRRALRRQGVRCRAAQGEAASADMAAVRGAREKLPQLLTHLGVTPRDTFNLDETALWLSVLPRRTYSNGRIPGRKRCWWRTGCLPLSWSLELPHVHDDEPRPALYPDIELDADIDDVGTLISGLGLGNGAMTAAEYVAVDDGEPTCADRAAGEPTTEPEAGLVVELWEAPTTMQAVYDDADPVGREARRIARAACEMLIGYARATRITPRDLCHLFDIRNPIIIARMERASPSFNLNVAPQPVPTPDATPTPETPRLRGRVLPGWMTQPSRRQQLLDAGVGAVMGSYVDAAEWMRLVDRALGKVRRLRSRLSPEFSPRTLPIYIVRFHAMPPAATYTGGILGFPATAAPMDDSDEGLIASAASAGSADAGGLRRAFDASQPHVRAYAAHLVRMHSAVLAEAGVDSSAHVYSYTYAMNGVAATLTPQQVAALKRRPEVGSVREAPKYELHTTFTPTFLNLRKRVWSNETLQNGQKGAGQQGENVIIGVIDTGIWRENPAFSDDVTPLYGPVPAQWKGSCMTSADFPSCNRKLIGARGFFQGLKASGYTMDWTIDYKSARDVAGHGTHTTSTAGGNSGVEVKLNGFSFGTASGMAPRARVAMYKVFWATVESGRDNCDGSDILKAVDTAVADGVDVISLSVGRQAPLFFDDDEMIYLNAARAGVLASVSAGNSGPTTIGDAFFRSIGHPSPWMITVAASSHGRNYMTDVTVNGDKFSGRSMVGTGGGELILGKNGVKAGGNAWMAGVCASGTLDPAKVSGKIVVCRRISQFGGWSSEDLLPISITVKKAGAAGVIIYNTAKADRVVAVLHPIPACHLDRYTGKRLVKLLGNSTGVKAKISASYVKQLAAPTVASFSSTGPNVDPVLDAREGGKYSFGYNDVLKPDITAPGLEVWAGWTQSPFQEPYGIASGVVPAASMSHLLISGTSMSCPHISGLAAIIKGKYPNWSPFALKSALMTTAYTLNNKNKPIYSAGQLRAADPFDYGTGHVDTFKALDPGLVYDSTVLENVKFLIAVDAVDVKQTSAYWAVAKEKRKPLAHP
ncbi:unnamed protein product [Closterium sp. NIES-65]|nr:unnamed protein product [Closterium sp. NIES-65]